MRIAAGFTQQTVDQPLSLIGMPDPTFYARWVEDFMTYIAAAYTVTATGNGAVAATTGGAGGRVTFTTNSSTPASGDIVELQPPAASIVMSTYKKTFFAARFVSTTNNPVYQIGLIQKTATPATIADGMVATRASAAAAWVFSTYVGSAVTGTVTVTDAVSGYDCDISMTYNGRGEVLCYVGLALMGPIEDQNRETLGPQGRFTPTSITAVALAPTLAMQSGTAASTTAIFDFLYAGQER
jgi:hypothetical protein